MDSFSSLAQTPLPEGIRLPIPGFKTFRASLDQVAAEPLASEFNADAFSLLGVSPTMQSLLRNAMHFLGLVDAERRPTTAMYDYVRMDDNGRRRLLQKLGAEAFRPIIELAAAQGTDDDLRELVSSMGSRGSSADKAANFYIAFAEYAGLPISANFSKPRGMGDEAARATQRRRTRNKPTVAEDKPALYKSNGTAENDRVEAYYTLLMQLATAAANRDEQVSSDLLDRIERTLGMGVQSTRSTRG